MREDIADAYLLPVRKHKKGDPQQIFTPIVLDQRKAQQRFVVDMKVKSGDIIVMFLVFKHYSENYTLPPTIMTGSASFHKN